MSLSTIGKGYLGATLAGLVAFGVMKWTDSNLFISAVTGLLLQSFITLWYSEDEETAIKHVLNHFEAKAVVTVDEVKQEADNVETKAVEEVKEVKEPFKVE